LLGRGHEAAAVVAASESDLAADTLSTVGGLGELLDAQTRRQPRDLGALATTRIRRLLPQRVDPYSPLGE